MQKEETEEALLLFSGGQDSTTCLFYALKHYARVWTLGFAYGQRHNYELEARKNILDRIKKDFPEYAGKLGQDQVLELSSFGAINVNALTSEQKIEQGPNQLPTTFVPGRNLLFLTYAAAVAYAKDCSTLVLGVGQADYSGYPDCRMETMEAMQKALSLGLGRSYKLVTPLMYLTKAETWALLWQIGGRKAFELVRTQTLTCYVGEHTKLHSWGYGCGECPACLLRKKGFAAYLKKARLSKDLVESFAKEDI
ncbi:MAG: 7-cyano-7-deazaguanine synthase QueC [Desulfovibrio sp.]|nr:7-cyano-7-deazaguanine synthase QueC [Desulfovibrio sp.]